MKAVVWKRARQIQIDEIPISPPGPGQVLVEMRAFGICGSDMKLYQHGVLGTLKPTRPFIMGHEGAGIVSQIGEGVLGLSPGQSVCINPQAACHQCFYCLRGEENLCEKLDFKSVTGDGVFSEFVLARADQLVILPEGFDLQLATLIEPLSVAVQACRAAPIRAEDSVLIFGAGAIGLLTLAVLRHLGVKRILVIDVQEYALRRAQQMGATGVANPHTQDVGQAARQILGPRGPDVVIESAGSSATQALAFELARPGGTLILIGISPDSTAPVNVNRLVRSNLHVHGSVRTSGDTFVTAAQLLVRGQVEPRALISRVFPLSQAQDAFAYVADKNNSATKCLLAAEC